MPGTNTTSRAPGRPLAPTLVIPAISIATWLLAMWLAPEPDWEPGALIGWGVVPFVLAALLAYVHALLWDTRSRRLLLLSSLGVTFALILLGVTIIAAITFYDIAMNGG